MTPSQEFSVNNTTHNESLLRTSGQKRKTKRGGSVGVDVYSSSERRGKLYDGIGEGIGNGNTDILENVVTRRLHRSAAEKRAMKALLLKRVAEREAALEKAFSSEHTEFSSKNAKAPLHRSSMAGIKSKPSIGQEGSIPGSFNSSKEEKEQFTVESAATDDDDTAIASSVEKKIRNNFSESMSSSEVAQRTSQRKSDHSGPWANSMKINAHLRHTREMKLLEEIKVRQDTMRQLKQSKIESEEKSRVLRLKQKQRSIHIKAQMIVAQKERLRREEETQAKLEKMRKKMEAQSQLSSQKVKSKKANVAKAQRKKSQLRAQRVTMASQRREEYARIKHVKRTATRHRMETAMRGARKRLIESEADQKSLQSSQYDRRIKAEKLIQEQLLATARQIEERESQRKEALRQLAEEKKKRTMEHTRRNKERAERAIRLRANIVNAHEIRKEKLLQKKQEQFQSITVRKAQQQYLLGELRRQIDSRDTRLRNFSARILENVDHISSVHELRVMAMQIEGEYNHVSRNQELKSWSAYHSASKIEIEEAKTVVGNGTTPTALCIPSSQRPRPHTSSQRKRHGRFSRFSKTYEGKHSSTKVTRFRKPSRPSTAGHHRGNRRGKGGFGGRVRRLAHKQNNSQQAGPPNDKVPLDLPLKQFMGRANEGGTCALCRHRFSLLPCRVLRKAVVEMQSQLGMPNKIIDRWKTAVLYDQVPICTFCSQWMLPSQSNTISGKAKKIQRQGPIYKSALELERENEKRLSQVLRSNSKENKQERRSSSIGKSNEYNNLDDKHVRQETTLEDVDVVVSVQIHRNGLAYE